MPLIHKNIYCRPQWKQDTDGLCDGCSMEFTVLKRRHHCRRCGGLFCSECTSERRILPTIGYTKPQRVCRRCSGLPLVVCGLQHEESNERWRISSSWFEETLDILIQYTSKEYPKAMTTAAVQCSLAVQQEQEYTATNTEQDTSEGMRKIDDTPPENAVRLEASSADDDPGTEEEEDGEDDRRAICDHINRLVAINDGGGVLLTKDEPSINHPSAAEQRACEEDGACTVRITRQTANELLGFTVVNMMVQTIDEGTPASRCGLAACQGMRLTHVDGQPVTSPDEVRDLLGKSSLELTLTLVPCEGEGDEDATGTESEESLASSGDVVIPEIDDCVYRVLFESEGETHAFESKEATVVYSKNGVELPAVSNIRYIPRKNGRVLILDKRHPVPLPAESPVWPAVIARLRSLLKNHPSVQHNLPVTTKAKRITATNMQLAALSAVNQQTIINSWLEESAIPEEEDA
eukprot:TRINITY_DN6797_c3_g1_i2.p1 TRINITY_DN6797_c3_g1~~TRINITY_DN6797_c3_g1_i2.p1  ORF type:complete len:463 (+),score=107.74 TRINITY_DN6797_c3_g1_i2:65-1453(+)